MHSGNQSPNEKIVTGVIGHDTHNIGIGIIQYALRKNGYKVVPLGAATTQKEFVDAAIETKADAILVSSLSGMAELECQGLRKKCVEAGLGRILLYVGGNLVVGKLDWSEVEAKFKEMGYDRVAPPGTRVETLLAWLEADLPARQQMEAEGVVTNVSGAE